MERRRPERVLSRRGGSVELLRVPALFFGVMVGVRGRLYDRGWLPTERLEVPVISVGNLTAGGTGKTPMVLSITQKLISLGRRPGILSRGYGAAPESETRENDEARMFARWVPEVPRVQDPDRAAGGRQLVERGADVIVLDDGFQHRRLHRDLDVVLIDATRPWGLPADGAQSDSVRALLPRGLLREKPAALGRAHAVVLTRTDQVSPERKERLLEEIHELAPAPALLEGEHRPSHLLDPGGELDELSALQGREVDLVSAIGNPEAFEATVRALGAQVVQHRVFPDHHAYGRDDLRGLGTDASGDRWLVTTAKDAVKLEGFDRPPQHVLEVRFHLGAGAAVLDALLESLPSGRMLRERRSLHEGLHG